ncbi:MAG: tetratricopeptide repeat protein [Myxococcaceae bacterium]
MVAAALVVAALLASTPVSAQARASFQRGEKALQAGQLEQAAAAYQEALQASPRFAEALNGLGSVLFRQGKRAEAVQKFQAAIAADPGLKLAYFNLGYAARKNGDFAVAAGAYETYLKLDPTDADGYFGLAEAYRSQGKAEPAVRAYQTYLTLESRPSEQRWVEKAKESIAQLKAQLAAAPAPAAAPSVGTSTPAVAATAAPAAPTTAALIAQGDALWRAGNASAAAQAYQGALQLEPTSVEALFKLGNAFAKQGDYRSAIEKWERVVQLSADAAVRKSAQENVEKARARLARAAVPAAGSPQALAREAYERGVRLVLARDYATALQALNDALAFDSTLAAAYTARGSANVGLRRFYEAAADYLEALRLDPSRASPLFGLAEAYRALGRTSDARTYYERYALSTAADAQPALKATARTKSAALSSEGAAETPAR